MRLIFISFGKIFPQRDKIFFKFVAFKQRNGEIYVAVVAYRLVQIENGVYTGALAPVHEVVDKLHRTLAQNAWLFFHHYLIETEANMVEAERGDIFYVLFGYVRVEMLVVAHG